MSELRKIVRAYMAADERSEAWVAEKIGLSRSGFNGWWNRGRTSAPPSDVLRKLASVTRTPYRSVLDAALLDYGYLPEEGSGSGTPAKKIDSPDSGAPIKLDDRRRKRQEVSDTPEIVDPAALDTEEGVDEEPGGSDHD